MWNDHDIWPEDVNLFDPIYFPSSPPPVFTRQCRTCKEFIHLKGSGPGTYKPHDISTGKLHVCNLDDEFPLES